MAPTMGLPIAIQAHGTPPAAHSVHAHADEEPGRYGSAPGHAGGPSGSDAAVDLPDVAWISARDGSRAPRDLEDQAARYHPSRHELTINADFRAITDLINPLAGPLHGRTRSSRRDRSARAGMVRADPRRGRPHRPQLDLEGRAARGAALAHVAHGRPATAPSPACNASEAPRPEAWSAAGRRRRIVTELDDPRPSSWSCPRGIAQTNGQEPGGQTGWIGRSNHRCAAGRAGAVAARPRRRRDAAALLHAGRSGSNGSSRPVDGHRDRGDDLRRASRRTSSSGRAYQSASSTGPNRGGEARRARRARPSDPVASAPAARGRASVPALSLLGASGAILCPRAIRGHIFTGIGGFSVPARAWVPVAQLSQEVLDLQAKHV